MDRRSGSARSKVASDASIDIDALSRAPLQPAPSGAQRSLPGGMRNQLEGFFGADFSAVRIHEGRDARAMGALAYTRGTDIHVARGYYTPGSERGRRLLGHELTHVVQQAQGRVRATTTQRGTPMNDAPALEAEADAMGSAAARALRGYEAPARAARRGDARPHHSGRSGQSTTESSAGVMQRATTIVDDTSDEFNFRYPGRGQGFLQHGSGDVDKTVHFGPLNNDCGTSMKAARIVPRVDDLGGTIPQSGTWPSWWAAAAPSPNNYWVRGHLLNHNIGGPGEKRNLTPITKKANSNHHKLVEKLLKQAAQNNHFLEYEVTAEYDLRGPTGLLGDARDPSRSVWPYITTGFACKWATVDSRTFLRSTPQTTFIDNER